MWLRALVIVTVVLTLLSSYLFAERIVLERRLKKIPLRIAVTGVRGKSSVVRLVAAALRASGRTVLARTTGSRPVFIDPDGSEHEIPRRGSPNLLEGKTLLERAVKLGADVLVCELMSITPEYLRLEARRLFRPTLLFFF